MQNLLFGWNDFLGQQVLERLDPAFREQLRVAADACNQALLRRKCNDVLARQVQNSRRLQKLTFDAGFNLLIGFQLVPHQIDLVEHGNASRHITLHVLLPDLEIRLGHSGIHCQQEQHRVRVGNHGQSQFRLCAQGVQSGRVENDQSLFKQRMRVIYQRVAPAWNVHFAATTNHGRGHEVALVKQPERVGFRHADRLYLGQAGHGFGHFGVGFQV